MPGKNYKKWHAISLPQIPRGAIQEPLRATITIFPGTARKFDLTNKAESIMDIMVDAGVLSDDNISVVPEVTLVFGEIDRKNPHADIVLESLE